jgi:hypothetical protein
MIIKPKQDSHWYDREGNPQYQATMREARKFAYKPSVTTVNGIVNKPALNAWSSNVLLDVAWRCMNCADMTEVEWKRHVREIWKSDSKAAADLGSKWHNAVERWLQGRKWVRFPDTETGRLFKDWCASVQLEPLEIEQTFCSDFGYGGRLDFYGWWNPTGEEERLVYIDWKTQGKPKGKITYYTDMGVQLAACAAGHGDGHYWTDWPCLDLVSVIISTVEPHVEYKIWDDGDILFGRFLTRLDLWADENNFDLEA